MKKQTKLEWIPLLLLGLKTDTAHRCVSSEEVSFDVCVCFFCTLWCVCLSFYLSIFSISFISLFLPPKGYGLAKEWGVPYTETNVKSGGCLAPLAIVAQMVSQFLHFLSEPSGSSGLSDSSSDSFFSSSSTNCSLM